MSKGSAKNLFNKVDFIGPDQVDPDKVVCPVCNTEDVSISGKVFYHFYQEQDAGVTSTETSQDECREIDQIICPTCQVCFVTVSQHVYDLLHRDDDFFRDFNIRKADATTR